MVFYGILLLCVVKEIEIACSVWIWQGLVCVVHTYTHSYERLTTQICIAFHFPRVATPFSMCVCVCVCVCVCEKERVCVCV